MAAHLLRLRLALLVAGLRGGARRALTTSAGLAAVAVAVAVGCWGLVFVRGATADATVVVTVLGAAALTLAAAAAPLALSVTDPMDPRRFAVLGMPGRRLAALLVPIGLISVPTAALAVLGAFAIPAWAAHGVPWGAGVLSVVLGLVTCSLFARVSLAVAALFLRARRSRELTGLLVMALLVVVVPVAVFLGSLQWGDALAPQLRSAADVVADTPFGAAWAIGATWGTGQGFVALAVAVLTIGLLALAWFALVDRSLSAPAPPASTRAGGRLSWFAVTPDTPGGAVAARSMVYWLGDRRYLANLVIVPVLACLVMVPLLVVGVAPQSVALVPVPIMALFFGWLPHNDLAYDATAIWMHVAGGVRGVSDRLGRLVPVLVVALPVLAVTIPVAIALHERWAVLPAMIGVCASLFLCGLGLSSVASAVAPYPVSRPGDGPFRQPERVGAASVVTQAVVLVGAIVLSVPALGWGWLTVTEDVSYAPYALWGGIAVGLAVLIVGVVAGGAAFDRRGSRLVEFAEAA
ncbi:hypothetical protein [Microbacterium sp.]|uniref:hypothetical protein n=1 Tax=Microbacterium sp. TaxID=51671 RepID=UPI003A9033FE